MRARAAIVGAQGRGCGPNRANTPPGRGSKRSDTILMNLLFCAHQSLPFARPWPAAPLAGFRAPQFHASDKHHEPRDIGGEPEVAQEFAQTNPKVAHEYCAALAGGQERLTDFDAGSRAAPSSAAGLLPPARHRGQRAACLAGERETVAEQGQRAGRKSRAHAGRTNCVRLAGSKQQRRREEEEDDGERKANLEEWRRSRAAELWAAEVDE